MIRSMFVLLFCVGLLNAQPVGDVAPTTGGYSQYTPTVASSVSPDELATAERAYYSAKRGAWIFNSIGTGLYIAGYLVFVNGAQTTTDCSSYSYSCEETVENPEQMLIGAVGMLAAIPFQIVGLVKIGQSIGRGAKLKSLERRSGRVSLVPTYDYKNNAPGIALMAAF